MFEGQTIYVTGASSGIGEELARQLAQEGARLALFARRLDRLQALAAELKARGVEVEVYMTDVADRTSVQTSFAAAAASFGPADVLVANAGVSYPIFVTDFDAAKIRPTFDINVMGMVHAIEAVLPAMIKRRAGHIVGISSLAATRSFPEAHVYCASKAAVSALLDGVRMELRPYQVDVTTICPGFVKTFMTENNHTSQPLLMDCDVAVRRIVGAMRRRTKIYRFPRRLYAFALLSRLAPDWLVARLSRSTQPPEPAVPRRAQ